ncbi:MAG TPA: hypothetical protein VEC01_00655, partial [Noviherbaspirillum sp.]|uniref:hypothetical protein n=1 Tax=Noviherbaspirillum sp. TaxID=1926288 RepID=UPI002D444529
MNIRPGHAGEYYRTSSVTALPSGAQDKLLTRYFVAVLAVVLLLVYLDFGNYANALNEGLPPKLFYAGYILMLAPLFLRFKTWVAYLLSPFSLWTFVVISINCVYLLSELSEGRWVRADVAASRIQMLLLALVLGMAFNVRRSLYEWIFPWLAL